jgi:hypothetical protein
MTATRQPIIIQIENSEYYNPTLICFKGQNGRAILKGADKYGKHLPTLIVNIHKSKVKKWIEAGVPVHEE